jgi:hypothetical protein
MDEMRSPDRLGIISFLIGLWTTAEDKNFCG